MSRVIATKKKMKMRSDNERSSHVLNIHYKNKGATEKDWIIYRNIYAI